MPRSLAPLFVPLIPRPQIQQHESIQSWFTESDIVVALRYGVQQMTANGKDLFDGPRIFDAVGRKKTDIHLKVHSLPADFVEEKTDAEIMEHVLQNLKFPRAQLGTLSQTGLQPTQNGTLVEVEIEVTGNIDLLRLKPQVDAPMSPVQGTISGNGILFRALGQKLPDVTAKIDYWAKQVRAVAAQLDSEASAFNLELENYFQIQLNQKRHTVSEARLIETGLPYPLKRRNNPPAVVNASLTRRPGVASIVKQADRSTIGSAEYVVPPAEYDFILRVLHDMGRALEYSPTTCGKLDEPDMRNILLVGLNSHYLGQAGAETFNGSGKTDILIRYQSTVVFVAECKIWKGPAECSEAIDQLLGYVTWRDTKAALIVFNRNKDLSDVLKKVDECASTHFNFSSKVEYQHQSAFKYKFKNKNDSAKEFDLTIMAFDISGTHAQ